MKHLKTFEELDIDFDDWDWEEDDSDTNFVVFRHKNRTIGDKKDVHFFGTMPKEKNKIYIMYDKDGKLILNDEKCFTTEWMGVINKNLPISYVKNGSVIQIPLDKLCDRLEININDVGYISYHKESIDFNEDDWEWENEERFSIGDRVLVNLERPGLHIKNREGEIIGTSIKGYLVRFDTRFNTSQFKYVKEPVGTIELPGVFGWMKNYGNYDKKFKKMTDMDPEHKIGRLLWIKKSEMTHI